MDVGSNSVRLVVFDSLARSPAYFFNEKVLCGLGVGLAESGCLHPEGRVRALAALRRFAALIDGMGVCATMTVATAAVRDADDGPDFCRDVRKLTGLRLHVASGEEEARLSAQGVLLGWPEAEGLVSDIGGASMELATLHGGKVDRCETSALGPLLLAGLSPQKRELSNVINDRMIEIHKRFKGQSFENLYLVGGAWRALGRLDMERRAYPLHVLHDYQRDPESVIETARWATRQSPQVLSKWTTASLDRTRWVPVAARVLVCLIKTFAPRRIVFSGYGIREGLLYEAMTPKMRALDPLIEACRFAEKQNARFPGFGDALFDWLQPLYPEVLPTEMRLIRAACLLHDTTWRAHPDYRAQMCFETVTRANLGGIDHPGRLFLATAIRSRYQASLPADDNRALALLGPERQRMAVALGHAMRLGAMLAGSRAGGLSHAKLICKDGELVLRLRKSAAALMGEVVEKRLSALAGALNCSASLRIE